MTAILRTGPTGLPALAALALGLLAFVAAVFAARGRRDPAGETRTGRSGASTLGIAIQALGFAIAAFGAPRVVLDPLSTAALTQGALVAVLMTGSVALFVWAARAMGRNWSLRARTRADHRLVQNGPFAWVRHPIYVAMFLYLVALAIALGHARMLALAAPAFALGTWVRVRSEEALLRAMFGGAHDAYAARVRRFVPGVF